MKHFLYNDKDSKTQTRMKKTNRQCRTLSKRLRAWLLLPVLVFVLANCKDGSSGGSGGGGGASGPIRVQMVNVPPKTGGDEPNTPKPDYVTFYIDSTAMSRIMELIKSDGAEAPSTSSGSVMQMMTHCQSILYSGKKIEDLAPLIFEGRPIMVSTTGLTGGSRVKAFMACTKGRCEGASFKSYGVSKSYAETCKNDLGGYMVCVNRDKCGSETCENVIITNLLKDTVTLPKQCGGSTGEEIDELEKGSGGIKTDTPTPYPQVVILSVTNDTMTSKMKNAESDKQFMDSVDQYCQDTLFPPAGDPQPLPDGVTRVDTATLEDSAKVLKFNLCEQSGCQEDGLSNPDAESKVSATFAEACLKKDYSGYVLCYSEKGKNANAWIRTLLQGAPTLPETCGGGDPQDGPSTETPKPLLPPVLTMDGEELTNGKTIITKKGTVTLSIKPNFKNKDTVKSFFMQSDPDVVLFKIGGAADRKGVGFIDGKPVAEAYGFSITLPECKKADTPAEKCEYILLAQASKCSLDDLRKSLELGTKTESCLDDADNFFGVKFVVPPVAPTSKTPLAPKAEAPLQTPMCNELPKVTFDTKPPIQPGDQLKVTVTPSKICEKVAYQITDIDGGSFERLVDSENRILLDVGKATTLTWTASEEWELRAPGSDYENMYFGTFWLRTVSEEAWKHWGSDRVEILVKFKVPEAKGSDGPGDPPKSPAKTNVDTVKPGGPLFRCPDGWENARESDPTACHKALVEYIAQKWKDACAEKRLDGSPTILPPCPECVKSGVDPVHDWLCPVDGRTPPFAFLGYPDWLAGQASCDSMQVTVGSTTGRLTRSAGTGDMQRSAELFGEYCFVWRDEQGKWVANAKLEGSDELHAEPPWKSIRCASPVHPDKSDVVASKLHVQVFGSDPAWPNYGAAVLLMRLQSGLQLCLRRKGGYGTGADEVCPVWR